MYDVSEERITHIDDVLNSKWEHTNEKGCVGKVVFSHLRKARNNSFSLSFFHYLLELVEERHRFTPDELYLFVCRSSKYDMGGFSLSQSEWDYLLWTMVQAFYPEKYRQNKSYPHSWLGDWLDRDEPIVVEDEDNGGLPTLPFH